MGSGGDDGILKSCFEEFQPALISPCLSRFSLILFKISSKNSDFFKS